MTGHRYTFVTQSSNRKTGPIPVTYTSRGSCPDSCPLKVSGCYANGGPVGIHWHKLNRNKSTTAIGLQALTESIAQLPRGQLWRHNVAGDLPGKGETIDTAALAAIVRANKGRHGFTFTHKPLTPVNVDAIREANRKGFTVNLSANGISDVDDKLSHGLPVVTLLPFNAPKVSETPQGHKIVQCPAETSSRVTCASCGLCARSDRSYVIGFKPKGSAKRRVDKIAQLPGTA